jgi:hypothetical protein
MTSRDGEPSGASLARAVEFVNAEVALWSPHHASGVKLALAKLLDSAHAAGRLEERERAARVCARYADYQGQLLEREKAAGRQGEWFALTCEAEQAAAKHLETAIRREPDADGS